MKYWSLGYHPLMMNLVKYQIDRSLMNIGFKCNYWEVLVPMVNVYG